MKAEARVSKFDRLHKQQRGLNGRVYVLPNGGTACGIQDLIPACCSERRGGEGKK